MLVCACIGAQTAQLMPVSLPDMSVRQQQQQRSGAGNGGGVTHLAGQVVDVDESGAAGVDAGDRGVGAVEHWAWDATGERLAVLLREPHPAAGCVAVYATSVDPVVHARLLGYARPPPGVLPQQAGAWIGELVASGGSTAPRGALFTLRAAAQPPSPLHADVLYNLPLLFR
jgi:hypothetical protein